MAWASSRCFLADTAVMRLGTILPRSDTKPWSRRTSLYSIFGASLAAKGQLLRRRKNGRAMFQISLFASRGFFALAARAAIATLAARTALGAFLLAHHDRRAGFQLIDLDGHVADDVFVDLGLEFLFRDEEIGRAHR